MSERLSDDWIASWLCGHRTTDERSLAAEVLDHRSTIAASHAELDVLGVPRVREADETEDTLSDDQLLELKHNILARGVSGREDDYRACCRALEPEPDSSTRATETGRIAWRKRNEARKRCAVLWNERGLLTLAERIQWLAERGGGR